MKRDTDLDPLRQREDSRSSSRNWRGVVADNPDSGMLATQQADFSTTAGDSWEELWQRQKAQKPNRSP
jgi:hypothetical protein